MISYLRQWIAYLRHKRSKPKPAPKREPVYCRGCIYYTYEGFSVPNHQCLCPERTCKHAATGELVIQDATVKNLYRDCRHKKVDK